VAAPAPSGENTVGLIEAAFETEELFTTEPNGDIGSSSVDKLSDDMVTLSLVPKSRWQTLLHLDLIKQRNKPQEAPKAPEKAPFFLPSILGVTKTALNETQDNAAKITAAERSRITKLAQGSGEGDFTITLRQGTRDRDFSLFLECLKNLPPSQADLEIRSLSPLKPYSELVAFVTALTERLRQKRDYELVQTWMAVFLRLHGETLVAAQTIGGSEDEVDEEGEEEDVESGVEALLEALYIWRAEQEREAKRLDALTGYCGGVVGFLRE
jgi:U3 small nucleolar RNA-associated protein 21